MSASDSRISAVRSGEGFEIPDGADIVNRRRIFRRMDVCMKHPHGAYSSFISAFITNLHDHISKVQTSNCQTIAYKNGRHDGK